MGGTLPALLRALRPGDDSVAPGDRPALRRQHHGRRRWARWRRRSCSCPRSASRSPRLVAGLLGLAVAAAALALDRTASGRSKVPASTPPAAPLAQDAGLALVLYAIAGGIALGYEVVWSELLVQFLSTRAHAFAVMLATYLAGLGLGSFLFARWSRPVQRRGVRSGCCSPEPPRAPWARCSCSAIGCRKPRWRRARGRCASPGGRRSRSWPASRWPPAADPARCRRSSSEPPFRRRRGWPRAATNVGRGVGAVAAVNTAGGVAGSLLTGFVLVPRIGLIRTIGDPGPRGRGARGDRARPRRTPRTAGQRSQRQRSCSWSPPWPR